MKPPTPKAYLLNGASRTGLSGQRALAEQGRLPALKERPPLPVVQIGEQPDPEADRNEALTADRVGNALRR